MFGKPGRSVRRAIVAKVFGRVRHRWLRRAASAAIAVITAVLLVAAAGAPAAGVKTRSASTAVGQYPAIGSVAAKCKRGEKAASGGLDAPGWQPTSTAPGPSLLDTSTRRNGSKGWAVAAENFGGGPGTLVAFAYCGKGLKLDTAQASATVPANQAAPGIATATCPSGTRVLSGGYSTPGNDPTMTGADVVAFSSHKSGKKSWQVSAANLGGISGSITAYAYCREGKAVKTRQASGAVSAFMPLFTFGTGTVTASCKSGERVLSGGFDNPGVIVFQGSPAPYRSFKSGRNWTVAEANRAFSTGTLTVFAYCEKK
jgi:hypothetical protein